MNLRVACAHVAHVRVVFARVACARVACARVAFARVACAHVARARFPPAPSLKGGGRRSRAPLQSLTVSKGPGGALCSCDCSIPACKRFKRGGKESARLRSAYFINVFI